MALTDSKNNNSPFGKQTFNLLRPAKVQLTAWDKVYFWISGTCRVIVIFVEIILIGTLVVRFVIDRESNDIRTAVDAEKQQYNLLVENERLIKSIQKVNGIQLAIKGSEVNVKDITEEVNRLITDLAEYSITFTADTITISVDASKERVDKLELDTKSSSYFRDIIVSNYESVGEAANVSSTYRITLSGKIIKQP